MVGIFSPPPTLYFDMMDMEAGFVIVSLASVISDVISCVIFRILNKASGS